MCGLQLDSRDTLHNATCIVADGMTTGTVLVLPELQQQ